ncbi:MAG: phenylalanine--tRNA ligase beta subunit-related protein [Candidatus Thorarchaeota archaeon]
MQIILTPDLRKMYPDSVFGSLIVREIPNKKGHDILEKQKQELERRIREDTGVVKDFEMIRYYNSYFRMWKKTYTYPIEYQINTIKNGRQFPKVSVLVDSMFIAELNNMILTSGHDLDTIQGVLTFDISRGDEQYLKISGKEQNLKKGDIFLKDEEGILACILFGPARRTSITLKTKNALYFAWCPKDISDELVKTHLNEILMNVNNVFTNITSEIQLIRS